MPLSWVMSPKNIMKNVREVLLQSTLNSREQKSKKDFDALRIVTPLLSAAEDRPQRQLLPDSRIQVKPNTIPLDEKNYSPFHRNRRSPSDRNAVWNHTGIVYGFLPESMFTFTFHRNTHPASSLAPRCADTSYSMFSVVLCGPDDSSSLILATRSCGLKGFWMNSQAARLGAY